MTLLGKHLWWAGAGYLRADMAEPAPWPGVKRVPVHVELTESGDSVSLGPRQSFGVSYAGRLADNEELFMVLFDAEEGGNAMFFQYVPPLSNGESFWMEPTQRQGGDK